MHNKVGHIFGTNLGHSFKTKSGKYTPAFVTLKRGSLRVEGGHIFGSNFRHMRLLYMIQIAHDTYDRHETKSHNSWSHFWGNFETHTFVIHDTRCT